MHAVRGWRRGAIAMVMAALGAATLPGLAAAEPAADVESTADAADATLSARLETLADGPPGRRVHVMVTVQGAASAAAALLDGEHAARLGGSSLLVGTLDAGQLDRLATTAGVVRVSAVEFRRTGQPLGDQEPTIGRRRTVAQRRVAAVKRRRADVPWSARAERALKDSSFEAMKQLNVLDGRTHTFAQAWRRGFAGEGSTVAVLDGGTDFGHPDLLDTWKTGADGWPEAYDPYGTLQWLLAPETIAQGTSWYVLTEAKSDLVQTGDTAEVTFAVRTGPSRNFAAPDGTVERTFTFPAAWSASGTVRVGGHPDDYLLQNYRERAGVLVVDPNEAGVYDTVYVDLDGDHDFSDEKPVTRSSPASYRDTNGDGLADISGGLLYYISDGADGTPVPGGPTSFGAAITGEPGQILAWTGDYDPAIQGHGTLTASNVAGQGVIDGRVPTFTDLPDGTYPGAVLGGAPHAKLVPYGDIYMSFETSTQLGYLLGFASGVDVLSNSYGDSTTDNDGFDAASQEADLISAAFDHATLSIGSTGNGAPGFGTVNAPSPSSGLSVGASTQFGGTGWDSIARYAQVVDNDVAPFSDRGPAATGANGVDLVADGAYSSGDLTLNAIGDGNLAWETWGGTSRSTPVTAGAAALVYQAWRQAHAGAEPDAFAVRRVLMSTARDLGYESWIQGAGSLDANRAVSAALGQARTVAPDQWRPGGYAGQTWEVFPHVMKPGEAAEQTFTVDGPAATTRIADRYLVRTDTVTRSFRTEPIADESVYTFNAPDYLIDISSVVRAHPGADLMVVRANFDTAQFDVGDDSVNDQAFRLLTYNWTDIDDDGRLWRDRDSDGVVDHVQKTTSSNIDGQPDIDWAKSELDRGEYVRFTYHRPGANALTNFVRNPSSRAADGIFIGLQHDIRNPSLPQTDISFSIEFYDNVDWPWLTTSPLADGSFTARIEVPPDAPYGMYDGAIVVQHSGRGTTVVPVSLTVGATAQQAADGTLLGATTFGGPDVAAGQSNLLYNNGTVFGAHDWTWRPESGDWRFFYLDVPQAPPPGTLFLADTTWDDAAPSTDLDTVVLGPATNTYQITDTTQPYGAPYILDVVGKSASTNTGGGVWRFQTATGGPEEVVTAPVQQGLHAFLEHQVLWSGGKFQVPFQLSVGSLAVAPTAVEQTVAADAGSFDVTFTSSIDVPAGIAVGGFGLSQFGSVAGTAQQDDPNDPTSASLRIPFTVAHASRATVSFDLGTNDADLYVLRDGNGDGVFTIDEIVASSATASGSESVALVRPEDGAYEVWVHGYSVPAPVAAAVELDVPQGASLTATAPTGPVAAGVPVTIHADWAQALTPGQVYHGEILAGPASAPTAISIPVTITRG